MRSLSARVPPPPGWRWSQDRSDRLIGMRATLGCDPFPEVEGEIVAAHVLDDGLGHALWVTVLFAEDGEDVSGERGRLSVFPSPLGAAALEVVE